ncbi:MAG: 2-C-methyl-D-erythritol 4-phosphate cytidylyltransferase [Chitinivibrionales bacterium]|nr:2-C-methyl-D-erythritol 4-phosphate cytidylyltransferase [Chitinivibrionales bacterium]
MGVGLVSEKSGSKLRDSGLQRRAAGSRKCGGGGFADIDQFRNLCNDDIMPISLASIIVAAGAGSRLGAGIPKAYITLGNKPLYQWSLEQFDSHEATSQGIIVVPQARTHATDSHLATLGSKHAWNIVAGGEHRWQSTLNGVAASDDSCEWVMIHDAARPFVNHEIIDALLQKRHSFKSAIIATTVVDTVRRYCGDACTETLDRTELARVGTPQLFHRKALLDAFSRAAHMHPVPTDEAMLMEKIGHTTGIAFCNSLNFKITTPTDLAIAEALCESKATLLLGGDRPRLH